MAIQPTKYIWMDGELVEWEKATTHVLTHTLHYGNGLFEGIRVYETDEGVAIYRLSDHIARLFRSAKVIMCEIPYSPRELVNAVKHTVRENGLRGGYIRPLVYRGYGEMGLDPSRSSTNVAIACWPWGKYLEGDGSTKGFTTVVSSWQRHGINILPPAVKATGMYLNSTLAKLDAVSSGFDEAIMLNQQGYVAEATGENIFVVRDGVLRTPPLSAGALGGIRRNSVMTLAQDFGIEVREENLMRSDLYLADEMFMTGTAAEVAPVRSVDHRVIGDPGPITKQLQSAMDDVTHGRNPAYLHWRELI